MNVQVAEKQVRERASDQSFERGWITMNLGNPRLAQTQSKLYPIAARWLEPAKKVYHQKGQEAEWRTYIDNLRTTYARRPALQREIQGL